MVVPLRSPEELRHLASRIASEPVESQKNFLGLFLEYLVLDNISPAPTEDDLETILCTSIRAISNLVMLATPDASLVSMLMEPERWRLIVDRTDELLSSNSKTRCESDAKFRAGVAYMFLGIMFHMEKREGWAEKIISDKKTYLLLFKIWSLKEGSINKSDVYYATYLIQDSMAHNIDPTDDPKRVQLVLRPKLTDLGNPETVGRIIIDNAKYHFRQKPFDINVLHQMTCLLFKVSIVADHPVAKFLSKQNITKRVIRVLSSSQLDDNEGPQRDEIGRLLKQSVYFVVHTILTAKSLGLDHVQEALENGFLEAILKHSPFLVKYDFKLYSTIWTILRCYLVYPSVIRSMVKAYRNFTPKNSWGRDAQQALDDYKSLGDLLLKRLAFMVYVNLTSKDHQINICASCKTKDQTIPFKRCTRCQAEVYCSVECQQRDWNYGGHKTFCNRIKTYKEETDLDFGRMRKPLDFVNQLVQLEVGERLGELHSIRASEFPNVPMKKLAVCLNLATFPATMKLLPFDVVYGPDDGQLALPNTNVGDRLWKEVQESNGECMLAKTTLLDGSGTIIQYQTTGLKELCLPYNGRLSVSMLSTKNPFKTVKDVVAKAVEDSLTIAYNEEFCRLLEQEMFLSGGYF
ncbi:hypothetical protein SCHPADRAFT_142886 [Schizopora paradoxa]|uniref:MYND-type domain-containing protein n=1 Tax=Schizopora paradoxa TaxID=27342 RepID=A0A0H2S1Z2_9AGAM|nr:hypothetical protein SCHPADRAFT_142886 [Schizopora paradoxa]